MRTVVCLFVVLGCAPAVAADGAQLYAKKCASCHGKDGQGTKKYDQPLAGNKSVQQLTKYVAETMPEDAPGSLSAADAAAVSAFVHDTFYSPVARERNKPARAALSRLTVRQYRNAVADVIGAFQGTPPAWGDKRGLKGEYYKGRRINRGDRTIERIDPEVSFDYGKETPDKEKLPDAHQFSMSWSGSVLAEETGLYEFVVRTEHATKLWVNDTNRPLIDAWVKSGNDSEFRAAVFLVGGRAYTLRLHFSKAKQGVDDSKKNPNPPVKPASVALLWKPPHGATEVIPSRCLSPVEGPEVYVAATPFPPDDRSLGWERGTAVSKEWDAATTDAALDVAGYVAGKLNALAKTQDGAADRADKAKAFARQFAERAFRRPLTSEQVAAIDRQFAATQDTETAVKRAVLLALKSPRFLYRESTHDAYDVASRLSFALWDSIPDAPLLAAAAAGQLATRAQVSAQATRMLADLRARAKVRQFFHHYLNVEHAGELSKDPKRFPGFDPTLVGDLRTSLDLFVEEVVWGANPDFRRLLRSEEVFVNARLAKFYGAEQPRAGFQKVRLDSGKRAGVLTHPFLLSAFAYTGESSPIHRGVFLTRGVLGLAMRPPPVAVAPLAPDLHPDLSTRERVALQTKPQTCMTCHGTINPLGFTLEQFDAVGRYRDRDHGKPVDPAGSYLTRDGKVVPLKGAVELGKFLADSPEVHAAFAEQVFHHVAQQPVRAYGPDAQAALTAAFVKANYDVRRLVAEAATVAALGPPRKSD